MVFSRTDHTNYLLVKAGIVIATVIGFGNPAVAQESEEYRATQGVYEEVVVLARKREESPEDVPVAMTVISERIIKEFQINSFDEMSLVVPGLISTDGSTGAAGGAIYLRGIGNGDSNPLNNYSVAINVDGMAVGALNIRRVSQFDLAQIEVLRGPQALFFGKNSPGGVIAMRTADPDADNEFTLSVGQDFVSDDRYVEFVASGPFSDTIGLRLATRFTDYNGYFDLQSVPVEGNPLILPPNVDGFPIGDEKFARLTLTAEPSDTLKVRGKLNYNQAAIEGGSVTPYQRFFCPFGTPQGPFGSPGQVEFPCEENSKEIFLGSVPASLFALDPNAQSSGGIGRREETILLSTLELHYDPTPNLRFTSVTGYFDATEEAAQNASGGPLVTIFIPQLTFDFEQFTQEIRLNSINSSAFNFMVGAFFESKTVGTDQNAGFPAGVIAPIPVVLPNERPEEDGTTMSAFAQVQWGLTDRLELSGGVRYTQEEKSLKYFYNETLDVTRNLAKRSIDSNNFSPEFGIAYRPVEALLVYASFKTGFKSGGFDGGYSQGAVLVPGYDNTYDAEEVAGLEMGAKGVFAQRRLAANLALYSYEYDDLQVGNLDADTLTFRVSNAASASITGMELDFDWLTRVEGLTLLGSLAYNDAKFDNFLSGCYVGQTPALGCNLTMNAGGAFLEQDLSGQRLNQAAEWSGTLGFSLTRELSGGLETAFSMNVSYTGDFIGNSKQAPADLIDSFVKIDARFAVSHPDQRWQAALLVRNITDEITYTATNPTSLTGAGSGFDAAVLSDRSGIPSRGRELRLRLSYRFD